MMTFQWLDDEDIEREAAEPSRPELHVFKDHEIVYAIEMDDDDAEAWMTLKWTDDSA